MATGGTSNQMAVWKSETAQGDQDVFALEAATDREIRVKHCASGHVLQFELSDCGSAIAELHRIDLNFASSFNESTLVPLARNAAIEYLKRSREVFRSDCNIEKLEEPRRVRDCFSN
jgi:hypothetical protein